MEVVSIRRGYAIARRLVASYVTVPSAHKLVAAFVGGAIAGWFLGPSATALQPFGDLFIWFLRVLVFPIVISTILAGLSSTAVRATAQVGGRVVLLYIATAFTASLAGTTAAALLEPGLGVHLSGIVAALPGAAGAGSSGPDVELWDALVSGLTNGGLLPVVLVTVAVALAIAALRDSVRPERLAKVDAVIHGFARLVRALLNIVMQYAPVGAFALIAVTFGRRDPGVAEHLARVFASVYLGQLAVVAGLLVLIAAAGVPVVRFLSQTRAALLTAFATGSSAATLPVEMQSAREQQQLEPRLFAFSLPLGAVINKTGTAVHLAVVAAFAWNLTGQPASLAQVAAVTCAAFVAAVATPPISGGSYVVMAGMLQSLHLPLGVIGVVAGIPFLGKLNTPINSLGRLVATRVVARWQQPAAREAQRNLALGQP